MDNKKKVSRQRLWQLRKLARGKCTSCGKPREDTDKRYCQACITKRAVAREEKHANGLCTQCGGANPTQFMTCLSCRKKVREGLLRLRSERRERGKCVLCGKTRTKHSASFCRSCLLINRARQRQYTGSKQWQRGSSGRPPTIPDPPEAP